MSTEKDPNMPEHSMSEENTEAMIATKQLVLAFFKERLTEAGIALNKLWYGINLLPLEQQEIITAVVANESFQFIKTLFSDVPPSVRNDDAWKLMLDQMQTELRGKNK